MKTIRGFIKFWDRFEWYLIGILLGIATLLCFIEVVRRAVFNSPTQWAEELIRYIIIFAVFIGVSSVTKKSEHIKMSVIIDLFSEKKRRIVDLVTASIGIVFSAILLISGMLLVADAWSSETLSEFGLNIPIYIPYLALPIGGGLMTLRLIGRIIDIITPAKEDK
ncbi:MAG TPA: TRAP transporter small permease [Syntrophales bacterium]|nr:TRAP transporter small permease [Syntrophales bacterium]